MATRDEVFRRFGPFQIEALVLILLKELNILRQEAGLPARTFQQFLDEIDNDQNHLERYDWMAPPHPTK